MQKWLWSINRGKQQTHFHLADLLIAHIVDNWSTEDSPSQCLNIRDFSKNTPMAPYSFTLKTVLWILKARK